MKRLLLDPWKNHAGPKGVMKRLSLDSNVLWKDICLTHEKTMLDPKELSKDFYWTQMCFEKSFAWPMKRPCWTQMCYEKSFNGLKRALKRLLLDPWKEHAWPKGVLKRLLLDSNMLWKDFCLTHEKTMLDPKVLWKDFYWTQTCYKKNFAWPMKRPCWTQRCYEKTFIGLKRAMKRLLLDPWKDLSGHKVVMKKTFDGLKRAVKKLLLDPWKDHAGPKIFLKRVLLDSNVPWKDFCLTHEKTMLDQKVSWKDFYWTQTCYEKSFAWPLKRPCWTQKCYEKSFIQLKRAMKRLLVDPWKDHAGTKGVMKRLSLDSNVLWKDICLTHEKTMLDQKVLSKDFYWTQTCYEKSFAWPMKRPCWTQKCYEKTFIGRKRSMKRLLLDPRKDHAWPKGVMKRHLLDSNMLWKDFWLAHEKTMLD